MKRTTFFLLVSIIGWAVAPWCAARAAEPQVSLLVRWQVVTLSGGSSETLIFRDGLVVAKTLAEGQATYHRASANSGAMRRLLEKLGQNRAGVQPTVTCRAESLFPDAEPYTATVTWFGKLGRQSRFAASTVGNPPPCGTEPENIALAVRDFLQDVSLLDVVDTVP